MSSGETQITDECVLRVVLSSDAHVIHGVLPYMRGSPVLQMDVSSGSPAL